ncbi:MAG: endolytic transglycosylase MltG [Acidimicrobiia bacterium]|nr:endolytic transglycosylase MltG [Acidimicrobiia bacterium]
MFLVLAILASPFILGAGWFAYQLRPGSAGKAVTIAITKDMGTSEVADLLAEKGVIDSALAFNAWATIAGAGPYDEGSYQMHQGQGVRGALSVLKAGQQVATASDVKLLLPPGLTNAQIAERVGQIPGHTAAKFLEIVNSNTIRSRYQPPEVTSLEGLLFPDTYFVGAKESEEAIARRLVARFDEIGDKIGLGNAQGLTPYQTVIAASLIQTEAKLVEDGPLISAVIRNRIRDGMQLQVDSTLCYAKGGCPPTPTDADKAIESPYNTYKIAGLPPTPIASVTEASLVAALNPTDVPYKFYVVSDETGKHAFATTLEEHERNVAAARAKGLL